VLARGEGSSIFGDVTESGRSRSCCPLVPFLSVLLHTGVMLEQTRTWQPGRPVNAHLLLTPLQRGTSDPTHRITPDGALWRACRTPEGPGTLRLGVRRRDGVVEGRAWGVGAGWLLDALPRLLGAEDDDSDFHPEHPVLRQTAARFSGLRIPRTGLVFEALVPAVLEQKVTLIEARRAWRHLVHRFGVPAPGPVPSGLRLAPEPREWVRVPSWEWHRAGVDAKRSRTVIEAARVADRLEETVGMTADETRRKLCVVPGIGVWTAAEIMQRAHGDADAVSVGDLHLPGLVGRALTGHPVDDAGMLELLEPYRGHRYRAALLIRLSGTRVPRQAPRFAPRDFREF
jgi:3-methyladenine DNA glycosylase/8-oxoguanine DNA glycosylase